MFNRKRFEAMLLKRNVSKEELADYLGISIASYYRRVRNNGNFSANEIRLLINFFGKEEVMGCLFSEE